MQKAKVPRSFLCARLIDIGTKINTSKLKRYFNKEITIENTEPMIKIRTDRALWKWIVFGIITVGIYPLVVQCKLSREINTIASKYDHRNTMHYLAAALLSLITSGIFGLIWFSNFSDRIGNELVRRNIVYKFSSGTFWGWAFFGALIIVGPFIYRHKLLKSMNLLANDYNVNG